MSKLERIKSYYEKKMWDKNRVILAVKKGWITKEEYFLVTGEKFTEESN